MANGTPAPQAGGPNLAEATLRSLGTIVLRERNLFLHDGYVGDIAGFASEYQRDNSEFTNFVGPPHMALGTQDYALENPPTSFWKDSGTVDWRYTPTGLDTFDNVFPESAAAIRLDTPPPHYAYLFGLVEIGSTNNLHRVAPTDVNGKARGRTTVWYTSRLGDVKVHYWTPAMRMKIRGRIRVQVEAETAAQMELAPLAVHIAPYEMLTATDWAAYVTAV